MVHAVPVLMNIVSNLLLRTLNVSESIQIWSNPFIQVSRAGDSSRQAAELVLRWAQELMLLHSQSCSNHKCIFFPTHVLLLKKSDVYFRIFQILFSNWRSISKLCCWESLSRACHPILPWRMQKTIR